MPLAGAITTRKRALPWKTRGGKLRKTYVRKSDGKVFIDSFSAAPIGVSGLQGSQITVSENHPAWKARKPQAFTDIGGEFSSFRQYVEIIPDGEQRFTTAAAIAPGADWSSITEVYQGDHLPTLPTAFPPFANSGKAELLSWGTKAIALCKPTNPVADASVFLGELLAEGKPREPGIRMWEERTRLARSGKKLRRSVGDETLNVMFGWMPIARDMTDFAKAISRHGRILDQFERDAGRLVRRSWVFKPLRSSVLQQKLNNVSPWTNPGISNTDSATVNKGQVITVRETTIERWFSGAFTYYVPRGFSARDRLGRNIQEANKLLGVSLTPDTVWNLTPWSWAIDWFTNAGDVISNFSSWAIDCLVLKYGYIMEHTVNRDTITFVGPTGWSGCSARPCAIRLTSESKLRYKATPYGFGITWSGFSPRQLIITAALGLSRS